jgi:hypothetical protein
MKQYCTVEQITSLSPEAQQRLREWWKPQKGDWACNEETFFDDGFIVSEYEEGVLVATSEGDETQDVVWNAEDGDGYDKADCLPLLSIGQCIELLKGRYKAVSVNRDVTWRDSPDEWVVRVALNAREILMGDAEYYRAADLIDALFAAVKAVLEVSPDAH